MTNDKTPVFAIDRAILASRSFTSRRASPSKSRIRIFVGEEQLRYEVRLVGDALHLVDATGQRIGVFSDIAALVAHAETITGT